MWEFMVKYANSFWKAGDYAFEVFAVIMAWALTLGAAYALYCIMAAIGEMLRDRIREYSQEGKNNGKKE